MGVGQRPEWIIVGGRRRLGRLLAENLADEHDLVLTSSASWEGEREWLAGLSSRTRVRTLTWDARDPRADTTMMADLERLGSEGLRLSGALLVAGGFPAQPLGTWTSDGLADTWGLNLSFPLLVAQVLAPELSEGACLQFFLDTAIHRPWSAALPYSAAKAALAALIPALARVWAPRVRVVGHAFGVVLPAEGDDQDLLAKRTLVRRLGEPADVLRAVRYAAGSPFLTGEVLTLDGGRRWGLR